LPASQSYYTSSFCAQGSSARSRALKTFHLPDASRLSRARTLLCSLIHVVLPHICRKLLRNGFCTIPNKVPIRKEGLPPTPVLPDSLSDGECAFLGGHLIRIHQITSSFSMYYLSAKEAVPCPPRHLICNEVLTTLEFRLIKVKDVR